MSEETEMVSVSVVHTGSSGRVKDAGQMLLYQYTQQ